MMRSVGHEHRQNARVAIDVVTRDLAGGEEADQGHVAQRVAHDLHLGVGRAEVRPATP